MATDGQYYLIFIILVKMEGLRVISSTKCHFLVVMNFFGFFRIIPWVFRELFEIFGQKSGFIFEVRQEDAGKTRFSRYLNKNRKNG
jgi:hypothetical protein